MSEGIWRNMNGYSRTINCHIYQTEVWRTKISVYTKTQNYFLKRLKLKVIQKFIFVWYRAPVLP